MFKWFWTIFSLGAPVESVVHSESLVSLNLYAFLVWLFRWFFVLDLNVTSLEIVKSGYGYFFFFNEINQHEKRVLVIDSTNCETCNVWRKLNRNQWRIQRNGPSALGTGPLPSPPSPYLMVWIRQCEQAPGRGQFVRKSRVSAKLDGEDWRQNFSQWFGSIVCR